MPKLVDSTGALQLVVPPGFRPWAVSPGGREAGGVQAGTAQRQGQARTGSVAFPAFSPSSPWPSSCGEGRTKAALPRLGEGGPAAGEGQPAPHPVQRRPAQGGPVRLRPGRGDADARRRNDGGQAGHLRPHVEGPALSASCDAGPRREAVPKKRSKRSPICLRNPVSGLAASPPPPPRHKAGNIAGPPFLKRTRLRKPETVSRVFSPQ
jgi:hypothetical protein